MNNNGPKFILTFEWHSLRRDLRRNFWIVILAGLIAFMGIYIARRSAYSPTYTSSATLAVRVKNGNSSTIDNLGNSADTAGIYAAVFQGASMQKLAAKNLGLSYFPGEVTASVVSEINLMKISVTADDPELAYDLLTSILEVYPQISDAIFSNAVIDMMEVPQMPVQASNQLSVMYYLVLILLAMVVQTCFIVLLSLLRETVKHERAFEQMIDGKLLGTIAHEKPHVTFWKRLTGKKKALLIDSAYSSLRFSEDYQKLATRLEYLKKKQNASVFSITSVAENEGKSTITVNLALALADRGYRVAVLDMDLRKPSLYKVIDYQKPLEREFSDVISGRCSIREYNFLTFRKRLFFALNKNSCKDAGEWLGRDYMSHVLDEIRGSVDFVLMDTPPTTASADAAGLARLGDRTLLVVRTDRASAAEINDTIATLKNIGGSLAGCILNDVYKPFTLWGQMGADDGGAYYNPYHYRNDIGDALMDQWRMDGMDV